MASDGHLTVSLHLPLEWRPLTRPLDGADGALAQTAGRVLALALTLGERASTLNEECTGLELEVYHLQRKVQLLMELLAQATIAGVDQPRHVVLGLSEAMVTWQAEQPEEGLGLIALWLHPAVGEPLLWPARIVQALPGAAHRYELLAELLPLGEASEAALGRYIFQQHRRAIADSRTPRHANTPLAAR